MFFLMDHLKCTLRCILMCKFANNLIWSNLNNVNYLTKKPGMKQNEERYVRTNEDASSCPIIFVS